MVTPFVKDMRVSSQAEAVPDAVKHVDGNALVSISLHANEVQIAQASAGAVELSDAIAHAAFKPELKRCGQQSFLAGSQPVNLMSKP